MFNKFNISLFFLVVIAYTGADVAKCNRDVPLIDNFDIYKIEGFWYAIKTGDEDISKKKCMTATVTYDKESGLLLREIGTLEGNPHELRVTMTPLKSTSEFEGESAQFPLSSLWVLATDYTSYLIWFVCKNGHQQDGILYVTVREKVPGEEVIQKIHNSLANAGFKSDDAHLFAIDHSSC